MLRSVPSHVVFYMQYFQLHDGYNTNATTQYAWTTTNQIITAPKKLKAYAEQDGLKIIPTKVETEYNGPK